MEKFLIINTFNGEGYSDSTAKIEEFSQMAIDWYIMDIKDEIRSDFPNADIKFDVFNDRGNVTYQVGEDSGSITIMEIPKGLVGVAINPLINNFEVVTKKSRMMQLVGMTFDSQESIDGDPLYGTCHHGVGEDDGDLILIFLENKI